MTCPTVLAILQQDDVGEEIVTMWDLCVCLLYYSQTVIALRFENVIVFLSIAAGVREVIDVKVYGRYDEPDLNLLDRYQSVSDPSSNMLCISMRHRPL